MLKASFFICSFLKKVCLLVIDDYMLEIKNSVFRLLFTFFSYLCTMKREYFKILCIDGGGMRGVIPAKVLSLFEERLERQGKPSRLCDYFDLICGTSTGAIIATGLALGMKARDILSLYHECAPVIFPPISPLKKLIRLGRKKALYERAALSEALANAFNQAASATPATLEHAHTKLFIPTYDLTQNQTRLLRNYAKGSAEGDRYITAVDATLASSAAPGYYNSYSFDFNVPGEGKRRYTKLIDNGTTGNTPLLLAFTEATATLGVDPARLAFLSLGTGDFNFDNAPDEVFGRYWFYFKEHRGVKAQQMALGNLVLTAQSTTSDALMRSLQGAGGSPRFVYERLQYVFGSKNLVPFDTSRPHHLAEMERMGQELFNDNADRIVPLFFDLE